MGEAGDQQPACALDDHVVHGGFQRVVGGLDAFAQGGLVFVVLHGGHGAYGLTVDNDLTATVAGGLEQHRIHSDVRIHTGSLRLGYLGASHFQALSGHEGVQRHILRLEGRHGVAILLHDTQKSCTQHALTHG